MMLTTFTAQAESYSEVYTQEQLLDILKFAPRCELELRPEANKNTQYAVLTSATASGNTEYFLEIKQSSKEIKVLHLQKTELNFSGYKVESKIGIFSKVIGDLVLGKTGVEVFLQTSSLIPGTGRIDLYQNCK